MAKIIVASPPIPGEYLPLLQLARALSDRGHRVTFLTGGFARDAVLHSGVDFVPLTGAADINPEVGVAERAAAGLAPGPEQLNHDLIHAFVNAMPEQHRALQRLLDEDPDQYLIANIYFLGGLPVSFGVPGRRPRRWIGVSVVPLDLSSDDTTPLGPAPVGPGEDRVAANRAANAAFAAAATPTLERLNEVLAELGATEKAESWHDEIVLRPDQTAVLTVPGFEFARSDLPGHVHLVGVIPAHRITGWEPPAWWGGLDGGRPVVVVTQGTVANRSLGELIEPTLTALADRDVTVVAALGRDPAELSIPVPANAHVARFVPFDALLPKASVLITNGGAGGTHQALAAGVPVIMAGETEDKPFNAARVAYHRLGVDLGTATPSPEAIGEAVTAVLTDSTIRANVGRLSAVYPQYDPVERIERLTVG
ncbi:glycosyl transferase [Virgisporangium aliadipatigenens]|uniref:Glycosyl transferase n=1 Tax=Virgisporangium aliadipatigenens TaxID=741659 RepID=A0A8J4DSI9_9ACTN|nr:glycosyltransferase [Virgisporangium aliadipatigenens]GIJ49285.1 glycosyl transferase [Virgisporangium aliadipatigenens]